MSAASLSARHPAAARTHDAGELRLFLEELCCDLARLQHVKHDGLRPSEIITLREVSVGTPGNYADIQVVTPAHGAYFIEIKYGYSYDQVVQRLRKKYARNPVPACGRLVLVIEAAHYPDWAGLQATLREIICPTLELEIWDEARLLALVHEHMAVRLDGIVGIDHGAFQQAVYKANWKLAFGTRFDEIVGPTLLWHFSPWTLKWLHDEHGIKPRDILRPGTYHDIAIVMADLCSFSSYVRDTRNDAIVRGALTAFYSQARQAVLESGGMLDKFVGDEIVGLFGMPCKSDTYLHDALVCAQRLVDIGNSVSEHWQQRLDRDQKSSGVHLAIALGDLNLMPLRPFSPSHVGFIGDSLNMSARLMSAAGPSDIVVSNSCYQMLDETDQALFGDVESIEAKNIGQIKCWRYGTRGARAG